MIRRSACPLAIVAAVGRNRAIGRDGRLPWNMPGDLARFRTLTLGRPMIMGQRTFASIGRVLPGRESIVISRNPNWPVEAGVHRVTSPEAALDLADRLATRLDADEISLIGGATLFDLMIGIADRLHMTFVDLAPEADTFFPVIDPEVWREVSRRRPPRHRDDEAACDFVDYARADGQLRAEIFKGQSP